MLRRTTKHVIENIVKYGNKYLVSSNLVNISGLERCIFVQKAVNSYIIKPKQTQHNSMH